MAKLRKCLMRYIVSALIVIVCFIILGKENALEASGYVELGKKRFVNSIGMEFVYIEPGSFIMGTPEDELGHDFTENQHIVTIEKGFFIQTTEVTQGQWMMIMGNNPSYFINCGENCPVESVSFVEVQEFIQRLNEKEDTVRYRLPTEAEWEYACRAGKDTPFNNGGVLTDRVAGKNASLDKIAWYYFNSRKGTHPVGLKEPNQWGIYDMHGNVWEWCEDWFVRYPFQERSSLRGTLNGWTKVKRGGSWREGPLFCRAGYRSASRPEYKDSDIGFRVVAEVIERVDQTTHPEPPSQKRVSECIISKVIFFDLDKAELRTDMIPILQEVVDLVKEKSVEIHISGHTCDLASNDYNNALSKRRAESAARYLIENGIPENRIHMTYYGEDRPREPNIDEEHRRLNRRVEIKICMD